MFGIGKNVMLKTKQTSKKSSSVYQKSLENDIPEKASRFWLLNTITHRKKKKTKIELVFNSVTGKVQKGAPYCVRR